MLSEKAIIMLCKKAIIEQSKEMLKVNNVSIITKITNFDDLSGDIIIEAILFTDEKTGFSQKFICTIQEDEEYGTTISLTKYTNEVH